MPNDLFDKEIAPQNLDTSSIIKNFENKITSSKNEEKELLRIKVELEKKLKVNKITSNEKKLEKVQKDIEKIGSRIASYKSDLETISTFLENYYFRNELKTEYYERTDQELLFQFNKGLLSNYKSDDVLLRNTEVLNILDAIRKEVLWD